MGCEFRGVMMAFRGVRKNEISITTFLILYINHQMFRRDKLSDKRLSGSLFAETLLLISLSESLSRGNF